MHYMSQPRERLKRFFIEKMPYLCYSKLNPNPSNHKRKENCHDYTRTHHHRH